MPFTALDGILLLVVLISAVLAMIRGFTREVFSIGSWVAAAIVTFFLWDDLLPYVSNYIDDEKMALGATVAGLFFLTLLVVSLITMRISDFVLDSRAGPVDRVLGFAFGVARGVLLVVIAVLFLDFFVPKDQPQWIANAQSKPWLTELGHDLMNRLPEDPESKGIEWLRNAAGKGNAPAADDAVQETAPAGTAPGAGAPQADPDEPGIAPDDQNQLERELNAPPED